MSSNFFTNQTVQQPAVGDLDLAILQTGALSGILSPNQSSPAVTVKAGAAAKIDTTITSGRVLNFLQAIYTDTTAVGFFRRTSKASTFAVGDDVEVVLFPAPVIWLLAAGTITPGAAVQNHTDSFSVVTLSGGKQRGYNLDYVTTGQLARILLSAPFAVVS